MKGKGLAGLLALCGSGIYAGAACAGDAAPTSDPGQLEEVVVTAQRRIENLQNVPITVDAVNAKMLTQMGIIDVNDLGNAVPGLMMNRMIGASTPYLRGVGTYSATGGQDPAVATYVDGVYVPGMYGTVIAFNNIEQVEVLKGPQGTLFGRNATGGAINIITKTPTQTPTLLADVGYGNFDTYDANVYASGGLAKDIMGSLAMSYHDQNDGPGRNFAIPGEQGPRGYSYAVATKLIFQLSEADKLIVAGDFDKFRNSLALWRSVVPGSIALNGKSHIGGYYDISTNLPVGDTQSLGGVSTTYEHDFSALTLKNIAAYRRDYDNQIFDQDTTSLPIANLNPVRELDRDITEELQLLSPSSGPFTWILGAYYLNSKATSILAIDGTELRAAGFEDLNGVQWTYSKAGYAQSTWAVLPGTNLTTGVRYTEDERSLAGTVTTGFGAKSNRANLSANKVTFRAALDHQFTNDVMGFVSYNRGFKSGSYNVTNPFAAPLQPEVLDAAEAGVKSDLFDRRVRLNLSAFYYWYRDIQLSHNTVGSPTPTIYNAAEAHIKGIDGDITVVPVERLTLTAGFEVLDGKYVDFPGGPVTVPNPAGGNTYISEDLAGKTTIRSPKFTSAVSATYKLPIAVGSLELAVTDSYNSGFYWEVDNRLKQPSYNIVSADATVRFGKESRYHVRAYGKNIFSAHYSIWTQETSIGDVYAPDLPATYGAEFGVSF